MNSRIVGKWMTTFFNLTVAALAITGMGQMPIFKRYYLADIPGFGWLAQYYVTHVIHCVAAALFLGLAFYLGTRYLRSWRVSYRLTLLGNMRLIMVAVLIISGVLRVLKNRPDILYAPNFMIWLDMIHIGAAFLYGMLALSAVLMKKKAYLVEG